MTCTAPALTELQATEALVAARNAVNAQFLVSQAELARILGHFTGKKVRKTSGYGGWTKTVEPHVDRFLEELRHAGFIAYISHTHKWLMLSVKTRGPIGSHGYVETVLSVARVDETGILEEIYPTADLRTDYSAAWLIAKRAEALKLERQARDIRSEIRELER